MGIDRAVGKRKQLTEPGLSEREVLKLKAQLPTILRRDYSSVWLSEML